MKLQNLLFILASATIASAALGPDASLEKWAAAEKECGSLGVMKVDPKDLPEGVAIEDVRLCADHPTYRNYLWFWKRVPEWIWKPAEKAEEVDISAEGESVETGKSEL